MLEDKDLKDGMALIKKMEADLDQITKLMTPKNGNEADALNVLDHHHHKWALNRIVKVLENIDKNIAFSAEDLSNIKKNMHIAANNMLEVYNILLKFHAEFKDTASIWLYEISKRR